MISISAAGASTRSPTRSRCPRVFTRETEMVSRSAAVEEYFQPKVVAPADFLRGIDIGGAAVPPRLRRDEDEAAPGAGDPRERAGEPILARWHVGLGWTLAWTSDVKNLWAVEWLRWPQYGQFWGQLVREHMRQKKRQQLDMRAEIDPATGHVKAVDRRDRRRRPLRERARRELTVTGPQPGGETRDAADAADGAGRYEATSRSIATARSSCTPRSRSRSTTARAGASPRPSSPRATAT
jgi:Ca-activated chloride channel family protein